MKKQNRKEKTTNRKIDVPKYFEKNDPKFMENPFAGYKNGLT